jgi:hypothetical protein
MPRSRCDDNINIYPEKFFFYEEVDWIQLAEDGAMHPLRSLKIQDDS